MTAPAWTPSPQRIAQANLTRFMERVRDEADPHVRGYFDLHAWSLRDPATFWRMVWDFCGVIGEPGERVLVNADQMPGATFFPDAKLNFAENLLRHGDDRPALVFRSETGQRRELSFAELNEEVARVAAALHADGVGPGDRVAGYLPNLPETIIAMLAATRLGAAWTSVSPDFGINGVVDRLGQVEPKVLFCAAAYSYNGKTHDCLGKAREIVAQIPSIGRVVVTPYMDPEPGLDGLPGGTLFDDYHGDGDAPCPRLPFDHPVYILYSSGTTGKPKCIVHGAGGTLLQHLKELVLHTDLKRADRICYFTTCGWMMWNWLVSSLAVGATVVLYEGSPFHPGPEAMFDLMDDEGITVFGTGAKAISAWDKAGVKPRETHDLSSLRTLLSTGSPLAPESFDYVYRDVAERVCLSSISGGTDIVSCFALGCPVLPVWRGELQCPGLGMAVEIRRDDGSVAGVGETGELCCAQPFPSMPVGFWNDPDGAKYRAAYFDTFDGVWAHGDYAKITEHGGLVIFGRSDATLNPGGVRIGTAEIYRQVEKLDEVLESLAIGQQWDGDERVV
ncbi:MAG: acetoacetate--CoA ligase, partial [Xanthomonadales bacterium]|nr:acetoacetate--CoA ligase [Xanthomonadales bacterium]